MSNQKTYFGSLENFQKGCVQVIDDNPKNYAFSNIFEVASKSKPYEKVAVGKNLKYVIEALRAEGTSPWFAAAHDEAALVMDGEVEVHYIKPDQPVVKEGSEGTVKLSAEPKGKKMGWVKMPPRPPGAAAGRRRLPVPQHRQARRAAGPDDPRREHGREVGRDLSDAGIASSQFHGALHEHCSHHPQTLTDKGLGYKTHSIGGFTFARDEYFAHIFYPGGRHIMPIDAFLRALMRDVAWGFFYGTVNFDNVFGTVNHYGTVEMFIGLFNEAYRSSNRHHVETFEAKDLKKIFEEMLDDWTHEGFDPFAAPDETGTLVRRRRRAATRRRSRGSASSPTAWSACRATSPTATRSSSR